MNTIGQKRFAILMWCAASVIGCSSDDKSESGRGGTAGGGGLNHAAGSTASTAVHAAGTSYGGTTNLTTVAGAAGLLGATGGSTITAGAGAGVGGGTVASGGAMAGAAGTSNRMATGGATPQTGGSAPIIGGAAGSPNSAAGAGGGSNIVWSWGQQGNEGPLADPDWPVDNVQRPYDGTTAVHPPALAATSPVELTIDCGAKAHTELSFYLEKLASAASLELLVDGKTRYTWSSSSTWDWTKFTFDVPEGAHSYTFRAKSSSDTTKSFALDSIVCKLNPPANAANATVDFDRGFVPPETTGGWVVDNVYTPYSDGSSTSDEAAIHPPALSANTTVEMAFDCGKQSHTELVFYLEKLSQYAKLDLLVDAALRYTWSSSSTWDWTKFTFVVPEGPHTYTFRAQASSDSTSSFVLDFIQCKDNPPAPTSNATVDFDHGFIPPESTGAWLVDNVYSPYSDGSSSSDEAAIHPPALAANTTAEMTFDCGKSTHTELVFYLEKIGQYASLELLVDSTLRQSWTSNSTWDWTKFVFDVPAGQHTYTFRAKTSSDSTGSFVLDFLQCKNNAPAPSSNATVDFDRGFIPPETTGGWLVDNFFTPYSDGSSTSDEAAIHPPVLRVGVPVDMTFDCGKASHSKVSYYVEKISSVAATLDVLVDGTALQSYTGTSTWDWKKQTFDVAAGAHSYTFRAQSATEAASSYVVDFLQCTP